MLVDGCFRTALWRMRMRRGRWTGRPARRARPSRVRALGQTAGLFIRAQPRLVVRLALDFGLDAVPFPLLGRALVLLKALRLETYRFIGLPLTVELFLPMSLLFLEGLVRLR